MKANQVDVVLRLMFEIAMSDGYFDKAELEILKKRAAEVSSEKASVIIKLIASSTKEKFDLNDSKSKLLISFFNCPEKRNTTKLMGARCCRWSYKSL